ncbi:MAG: hypothetical protein ABFS23_02475 [Pseudomonadota bacterium]
MIWSRSAVAAVLLVGATSMDVAAEPKVHGFGGHSCEHFLGAYRGWEAAEEAGVLDYAAYQHWLAGLATGLSLATGEDVLRGADVEGLMRRIRLRCEDERTLDVFGAAMTQVSELSALK